VSRDDWERVWEAIAAAAHGAQIKTVRNRGNDGVVCGVEVEVTIGERTASVTISWHYENAEAAPRLATAYPTLLACSDGRSSRNRRIRHRRADRGR
jgi:hypothetical protein